MTTDPYQAIRNKPKAQKYRVTVYVEVNDSLETVANFEKHGLTHSQVQKVLSALLHADI